MAGSKLFNSLMHAAEGQNARVLLVGDTRQLGSVEAGRAFAQLQENVKTFRLETILRQQNSQLRDAVESAYAGRAAEALQNISAQGGVIQISNPGGDRLAGLEQRAQAISSAFLALPPAEREGTIVIAPGLDDRQTINSMIRQGLVSEGTVHEQGFQATALNRQNLTKSQIRSSRSYQPGNVVRFSRTYAKHGVTKGSYWTVTRVDGKSVLLSRGELTLAWQPSKMSKVEVYQGVNREVAQGDKIVFTRNAPHDAIVNGETARVNSIDPKNGQAAVTLKNGQTIDVNLAHFKHWNHCYAVTTHQAQGSTADRALIHAESHRPILTNQKSFYVAISRAKNAVQVFTDNLGKLSEGLHLRSGEKEIALEVRRRLDSPDENIDHRRSEERPIRPRQERATAADPQGGRGSEAGRSSGRGAESGRSGGPSGAPGGRSGGRGSGSGPGGGAGGGGSRGR